MIGWTRARMSLSRILNNNDNNNFYCGLMVHITDTRSQKVVSCTSAHITETVFAHDQH